MRGGMSMDRSYIGDSTMVAKGFAQILLVAALCSASPFARADKLEEKATMCGGCHGENGIPQEKTTPVIWGQHQGYLYLNLRDYKRGDRKDDQMTPVVDLLDTDDIKALAEYFSKKQWPRLGQPATPRDIARSARRTCRPPLRIPECPDPRIGRS